MPETERLDPHPHSHPHPHPPEYARPASADVVAFESLARSVKDWAPDLVPGLLRTADYSGAVLEAYEPVGTDEATDGRPASRETRQARQVRARIFDNPAGPRYWVILDEVVIRRPVGGPHTMAEQLRHIAALVRRHRIIAQVLPLSEGAHAGLEGPFKLMTFDDAPPVAYVQVAGTGRLSDDPAVVTRCTRTHELLGTAALPPLASLALIEQAAEEYESPEYGNNEYEREADAREEYGREEYRRYEEPEAAHPL
ncbi:hypothetical protein GCM10010372_26600 [Streptomyces tauricus]|uniref:DUF5753 domain-containing protein n=1 Tax=Streptomyces tauricus TaxID=68274 RepID=UPI0016746AC1|nr:DUF5753 domain-containing protein [Streptomyces tauricus]GHA25318.1 hypothetical protein GCM10010372_26600 [Streptomyces tauricus]